MESFFGAVKSEFFCPDKFGSLEELQIAMDGYSRYCNQDRIKLKSSGLSPVDFRKRFTSIRSKSVANRPTFGGSSIFLTVKSVF